MAKKRALHRKASRAPQAENTLPATQLSRYDAAIQMGDYSHALELAQDLIKRYPQVAKPHELHANALGRQERFADAVASMQRMLSLLEQPDPLHWLKLAQYHVLAGQASSAVGNLERVVEAKPDNLMAQVWLSRALHQLGDNRRALAVSDRILEQDSEHEEALLWRARVLDRLNRHDETLEVLERLLKVNPSRKEVHNHIASLYVKESDYESAEYHYRKELDLDPDNRKVMANLFSASHYNPGYTAQELFEQAQEWNKRYSPQQFSPAETARIADRRLRVALLSGGFRMHPVGQLILPAIKALPKSQFELIVYSTSQASDFLTDEFRTIADRWDIIEGVTDTHLDRKIRDDAIDILIDMNGAGDGSRYEVLVNKPAPLMIKWVGSMINTTGLECFDYLLSDAVETPEGVDDRYTEKLIRLPDDYICYHMPRHAPLGSALPALKNGYITFGCLNNPAKLSPPMLAEWAVLMNELPNSRLLLRGVQFESPRFRSKIAATLAERGIAEERVLMEGPGQHQEFLATYQRIDIALDSWPYSGGLTTCEALMMGVPVVTRVGPTFAGRHSASHLINAGLSELVTDSWESFRRRVKELANDLPNLAVIRAALRTILIDSPICDGPRFANNLTTALRAIWQRHCEGKAPEALTFSKSGAARFADEDSPVKLALALPCDSFDWQLESPVLAVDNGAVLASRPDARELLGSGRVVMLSFDPGGKLETVDHLAQYGEIQHFPLTSLGDGQPATLHITEGAEAVSLAPLVNIANLEQQPIPTVALDSIEGLPDIDLLALDANHDTLKVLENATQALRNTLLIQARVKFQFTHDCQPSLAGLHQWGTSHGFRFYRFHNESYCSYFPDSVPEEKRQATELVSADAIFLPSHKRTAQLSDEQRTKLAFLLHAVFGAKDIAYKLLAEMDQRKAEEYLIEEEMVEAESMPVEKRQVTYDPAQLECNQREFTLCVGVPVYNEEKFIRETLQSLKRQDFNNVKFLISDNCSIDGTLEIVREETADDERFEIFQQHENIGSYDNFEFVFKNSKSKYFMWLGAHDYLSDNYLSSMVGEIKKTSSTTMVMGVPMAIDEQSVVKGIVEDAIYDFSESNNLGRYINSVAKLANCTVFHSVFRRSCLDRFEFRRTISPDHVLISHLLWSGKLVNLSDVTYFRRYFSLRKESTEERLLGSQGSLDREDFYQYYIDDLAKLTSDMPDEKSSKIIEVSESLLRERFG
ncbi:glycosyltransferase [Billgrantia montanilacus]|nr:glycosyltransferase [Halomonas montanilacus]